MSHSSSEAALSRVAVGTPRGDRPTEVPSQGQGSTEEAVMVVHGSGFVRRGGSLRTLQFRLITIDGVVGV